MFFASFVSFKLSPKNVEYELFTSTPQLSPNGLTFLSYLYFFSSSSTVVYKASRPPSLNSVSSQVSSAVSVSSGSIDLHASSSIYSSLIVTFSLFESKEAAFVLTPDTSAKCRHRPSHCGRGVTEIPERL
jgi:hypothetical protein